MRKSKSTKSTEEKKSPEESESVEEEVVENVESSEPEPVPVPVPVKPKPKLKPVAKKVSEPERKLKIINRLTQKININILNEDGKEQHVEIDAKQFVVWPIIENLGGQVNTLVKKKMLKVHPFIPES
jgi:hypothetical protein